LLQSADEGKDVRDLEQRVKTIMAMEDENPEKSSLAAGVYNEIAELPVAKGYKYIEPSDLQGIRNQRAGDSPVLHGQITEGEHLYNKIYGAWLGRCAGCLLGKPIEGWHRDSITGLLRDTGNYPFKYYISSEIPDEINLRYDVEDKKSGTKKCWINNVRHMPEDDDTNYTIIGLKIFEKYGSGFTPDDVAECWLSSLPILHVCTAERVAYKNLVNSILPPDSASFRNAYREWIGAQIRADFFDFFVKTGVPQYKSQFYYL